MQKNSKKLISLFLIFVLTITFNIILPTKVRAETEENKVPVILLHGRTDNSETCFGAINKITKDMNTTYNEDEIHIKDLGSIKYSNIEAQKILHFSSNDEDSYNLGIELIKNGYKDNKTLFVFNYPNTDFVEKNAEKLSNYIKNLIKEYGYKKFDLVGHSMGGLVARYYTENLNGDSNIRKIITIDTPHWGSYWAYSSVMNTGLKKLPCDMDLQPDSLLYGGKANKLLYTDITDKFEREYYINNNQSKSLDYKNHNEVKYYTIAGVNYWNENIELKNNATCVIDVPIEKVNRKDIPILFDEWDSQNNLKYKDNKASSSLINKLLSLSDLANDTSTESLGDDVVNFKSQIGWRNSTTPEKIIKMNKISVYINPVKDKIKEHSIADSLHCRIQHQESVIHKVIEYLSDENIECEEEIEEQEEEQEEDLGEPDVDFITLDTFSKDINHSAYAWNDDDTDNVGEYYGSGYKFDAGCFYNNVESTIKYYLNEKYKRIKGKVVLHNESQSTNTKSLVRLYGDDELLYESNWIKKETLPQDFNVDISDVKVLKVFIYTYVPQTGTYDQPMIGIVDTGLYRK